VEDGVNKMSAMIYWHPDCALHQNTPSYHPESPERVAAVRNALLADPQLKRISWQEASSASDEVITLVHSKKYWQRLQTALPEQAQWVKLDSDTGMNRHSLHAARLSVGGLVDAINAMAQGKLQRAFCLTRPPGHHAMPSFPMGFCLLSNVAIAAKFAQTQGFKRIAVVDFDVHHGNGTAEVARSTPNMLLLSSFQHPHFSQVSLRAEAHERVVLMPLPAQSGGEAFIKAWQEIGLPALDAFKPDLIFFSAGFDAHAGDPLAQLNLKPEDFAKITQLVMQLADKHAQGRVISALEGGYVLSALGASVVAHCKEVFVHDLAV
jgi:acetoin utilization deacetylase AcuC-like enzyme